MTLRARRGVALAIALFALVAVAALVHAALAPALANQRAARRLAAFQWAETLAERAVARTVGDRPPDWWRAMAVGATIEDDLPAGTTPPLPPPGAVAHIAITRLSSTAFLLQARASVPAAGVPAAAHRLLFLELQPDSVQRAPALVLGGDMTAGRADVIEVSDACVTDSTRVPVVMVAPSSSVSWGGAADSSVGRDSAALDAGTYARPAGLDLAALRAAAGVRLPPGASVAPSPAAEGGRCAIGPSAWGEPLRGGGEAVAPCMPAYPVVVAEGDLRVAGGRGQGVLLVTGRLRITGPFRFSGVVVASGGIETDGDDVTVHGTVFAGPSSGAAFRAARTTLRASSCVLRELATTHAALTTAPVRPWGR